MISSTADQPRKKYVCIFNKITKGTSHFKVLISGKKYFTFLKYKEYFHGQRLT